MRGLLAGAAFLVFVGSITKADEVRDAVASYQGGAASNSCLVAPQTPTPMLPNDCYYFDKNGNIQPPPRHETNEQQQAGNSGISKSNPLQYDIPDSCLSYDGHGHIVAVNCDLRPAVPEQVILLPKNLEWTLIIRSYDGQVKAQTGLSQNACDRMRALALQSNQFVGHLQNTAEVAECMQ